jgi:hypothetical protein
MRTTFHRLLAVLAVAAPVAAIVIEAAGGKFP